MLKTNRVRADTTVVPADVAYPTDSGLLAKGVAKMAKAVERLKAGGLAPRIDDPRPHPARAARTPAPSGPTCVGAPTRQKTRSWPSMPAWSASRPRLCARRAGWPLNARRTLRRLGDGRPGQARGRSPATSRSPPSGSPAIARQTRQRLAGVVPDGATRLVSLHDPDARPIRKGRLGKPVEFGYKAQVVDNEDGVVLDHLVVIGNPPDAPMLVPAIERVTSGPSSPPGA